MSSFSQFFTAFSLPQFGTAVLAAILIAAAYTFAVALGAGTGRPRLLQAARLGAFGTVALVGVAVLTLAYAFVSHDFRISYVAHYSDRTMSVPFLIAALWGGQDGSLLWWLFLTSFFSGACIFWMRRKYLELQPYVVATLMSVIAFFAFLMIFADNTNPFAMNPSGAPDDGAGLNYQLRDIYMIIHPPSLYIGFTSAAVPFAFAVAALVTGRLDNEWIVAVRKWMLFSWLFLSIGNWLGMVWAYHSLGWGGPWAWDPVENAAFLPWLTATAYVHSTMIQERRGMLKVWNVFLICMTFFLTIFGTFLTRSGLIASVHAFAQSGIGVYFAVYMGVIILVCVPLIVYRLPRLRSEGSLESPLSREAAFLANNWGLLSLMVFIAILTTWPRISEWLLNAKATIGPTVYNQWLPPIALSVLGLMGVAPLLGWRKTSPELFRKSFRWPLIALGTTVTLHLAFGNGLLFPAIVRVDPLYDTPLGHGLARLASVYPLITLALVAFNIAVVVQEFVRGVNARRQALRAKQKKAPDAEMESVIESLFHLVAKSRRRYGGYVVHVGISLMFVGFAGRAWGVDNEVSLKPGESAEIAEYKVTYIGTRREVDEEKMMILADVDVHRKGEFVKRISPGKSIFKASPDQPKTEVALYHTMKNDLYVVLGMANPQTKVASFQLHVNHLISFMLWFGILILIFGAAIAMWPDIAFDEAGAFSYVRAAGAVASTVIFGFLLASGASSAYAAPASGVPPHASPPDSPALVQAP